MYIYEIICMKYVSIRVYAKCVPVHIYKLPQQTSILCRLEYKSVIPDKSYNLQILRASIKITITLSFALSLSFTQTRTLTYSHSSTHTHSYTQEDASLAHNHNVPSTTSAHTPAQVKILEKSTCYWIYYIT